MQAIDLSDADSFVFSIEIYPIINMIFCTRAKELHQTPSDSRMRI